MVPQVVDDTFHEFLREPSRRGLNRSFLLRGLRPDVLVKRGLEKTEGFLESICGRCPSVRVPRVKNSRWPTSMLRVVVVKH